jgi:hypothetical protein
VRVSRLRFRHDGTLRDDPRAKAEPAERAGAQLSDGREGPARWLWMGDPSLADPAKKAWIRRQSDSSQRLIAARCWICSVNSSL